MTISHSAKFTLCVACSFVLHGLVLQQMSVTSITAPRLPEAASIVSVRYIAPAAVNATVAGEVTAKVVSSARPPKSVDAAIVPSPSINYVAIAPTEAVTADVSSRSVEKIYYASADVDTVAAPETDWPITVSQGLPAGLFYEAKVSIWVSAEGNIDRLEILDLKPESQRVRSAIEAMVGIILQPAMRGGFAVASQRNIELWLPQ
jgi:hypothetical protein